MTSLSALPAAAPEAGGSTTRRRRRLRKARVLAPASAVVVMLLVAAFPQAFAGWFGHGDPRACELSRSLEGPQSGHPFGFDLQGCDLYSNVIYGTRSSLTIGLLTTAGIVVVAVVLGCLAAYYRGLVDAVVCRAMDVFFGFPNLIGALVVLNTIEERSAVTVSLVLILFSWPGATRLMRSAALSTVNLQYVRAARGIGAGPLRILTRHVLPNSFAPLAVVASLGVGAIISAEAALTFLGVGLKTPSISWGVQLNAAQDYFDTSLHVLLFPSLFLSVTVLAFVLLGDALRDALDPGRA